jgi:hypothetical protein
MVMLSVHVWDVSRSKRRRSGSAVDVFLSCKQFVFEAAVALQRSHSVVVVRKVVIAHDAFINAFEVFVVKQDVRMEERLSHKGLADFSGGELRELGAKKSRSVRRR